MSANAYQNLINALTAAPQVFEPNDLYQRTYTVFGPGGVSWLELAKIIEALRDTNALLLEASLKAETEPEYEYGYSHSSAMKQQLGSIAGNKFRPSDWFATSNEAEAARLDDRRWPLAETFLVTRISAVAAGEVFALHARDA